MNKEKLQQNIKNLPFDFEHIFISDPIKKYTNMFDIITIDRWYSVFKFSIIDNKVCSVESIGAACSTRKIELINKVLKD